MFATCSTQAEITQPQAPHRQFQRGNKDHIPNLSGRQEPPRLVPSQRDTTTTDRRAVQKVRPARFELTTSCTAPARAHARCPHALMPSCPHALMPSCPHALMPSCPHALMPDALMPSCPHARCPMPDARCPMPSCHEASPFAGHACLRGLKLAQTNTTPRLPQALMNHRRTKPQHEPSSTRGNSLPSRLIICQPLGTRA
jgi:hypothetical protein